MSEPRTYVVTLIQPDGTATAGACRAPTDYGDSREEATR